MTHEEIRKNPEVRVVTYTRTVVEFRPHKKDPNWVRITVGENLITYPGEVSTRTAHITATKMIQNSDLEVCTSKTVCNVHVFRR